MGLQGVGCEIGVALEGDRPSPFLLNQPFLKSITTLTQTSQSGPKKKAMARIAASATTTFCVVKPTFR